MNIARKLCCNHLLEIEPYQSARRLGGSGEVWLNANELPYSYGEYRIDSSSYQRYPQVPSESLFSAYADYSSFSSDQLLCVRGADEGIELLIRAFCTPGSDSIAITPPTYGMYQVSANIHGVGIIEIPRTPAFDLDVEAVKAVDGAKLVFICSPNNPTGNVSSQHELRDMLERFKDSALVVVDEAYIEFCPEHSLLPLVKEYPNLVIIRTLSKAFGLAAVRCGFVLAAEDVIELLAKIIAPYPVPLPVEQIAMQALSAEGQVRMRQRVEEINRIRNSLLERLAEMHGIVKVTTSFGNFVLVEFNDEPRAVELLAAEGVVVRTPYTQGLIHNSQRISIGTAEQMDRVVSALRGLA
ncbi:MAG: histidinol-phosphate transaminase [Pseudomonadales bacterium]|jgi:histidinol-phosphate aminotransferase|nr:histidinol-phosphate transaminase [Pseudomonadales bacterium]MDP7593977.1 histidinol-phosphate transaminase [Pseudomonadales bacterium]HJN48867.1 histidinol-phosphate transaminase [Pseudomonadales bacterium]|tara:strand:+ start:4630 stop:5691 length:1062 start_codon:yes stop_codon:yes gene_type:complete